MSDHEGSNASGSQSGDSAQTWDSVDSGMSEDVENALTGQGVSDRETSGETDRTEADERGDAARIEGANGNADAGGGGR